MTLKLLAPQPQKHLHFSYSQLNTYLLCPMKYAHNYVWGTEHENKPINLITGTAVHKAAERFYKGVKESGKAPDEEQIIDVFTSRYDAEVESTQIEIVTKKGQNLTSIREQGIELVKLFCAEVRPQKIVAVESPFSIEIPDLDGGRLPVRLNGFFDLIESDSEGNYLICELKTSAQKFSSLRLAYDLQPTVYSYAIDRMRLATSASSSLVRYDVLVKSKKPVFEQYFVSRNKADHQRLIHLINQVLEAIDQRLFYRLQGWMCEDCQFRKACLD